MTYVPADRHDALVFIVRGLMCAIESQPISEAHKDQMTEQAQYCLRELGVGLEELELAIYSAHTEAIND